MNVTFFRHRVPLYVLVCLAAQACTSVADDERHESEPVATIHQAFTEPEQEPNDSVSQANSLKMVDLASGILGGTSDFYVLPALPFDRPYAFVDNSGNPSLDTQLDLYNSTTFFVISSDDNSGPGLSSVIVKESANTTGDSVFLEVSRNNLVNGSYTLHSYIADPMDSQSESEPNDSIATAEPITNARVLGSLGAAMEVDYFAFEAKIGDEIAVIVDNDTNDDGSIDTAITIVDSNNGVLATGNNGGFLDRNAVVHSVFSDGTYYLRVASMPNSVFPGEYDFVVLVNGQPPVVPASRAVFANNITTSDALAFKGHHPVEGDVVAGFWDHWEIYAKAGDIVYAYVDTDHASPSDQGRISLFTATGTIIEGDTSDGGNGAVIAGAVAAGNVSSLRVGQLNNNMAISDYHLFAAAFDPSDMDFHVQQNNQTIATAQPLNQLRNRSITTANDVEYYSFEAEEGDTVVVIMDENPNDGTGLDLSLSVRDASDTALADGDNGHGNGGPDANAVGPVEIFATGTYFIRVANDDVTSTSSGPYEFVLLRSRGPVDCGDADLDGVESCDDGNELASDGCDDTCQSESGWSCGGEPSVCTPNCNDGQIVGPEACDDGNNNAGDGCNATCTAVESGWTCNGAPSSCSPICNDGLIVGSEACDDGNNTPGDGCNATCTTVEPGWTCMGAPSACAPICNDGLVVGPEACDDGNNQPGDGCNANCTAVESGWTCMGAPSACAPICGNGQLHGVEACDDGNIGVGDGCSASCTVEAGWFCSGQPSNCVATCGDGLVVGTEGCDDGNVNGGDGCSAACAVEQGFSCSGQPSVCTPGCGDGVIAGSETCDDGNTAPGDGCNASCTLETGWSCSGQPSVCVESCGDGILIGSEACDDGNTSAGDGCSATCAVEAGYTCSGDPSTCSPVCGDGLIVDTETCDDGNTAAGDGCDADCSTDNGWTCTGEPSVCTEDMGQGGMGQGGAAVGGMGQGGQPTGGAPGTGGTTGPGTGAGGSGGDGTTPTEDGGCGCEVVGRRTPSGGSSHPAWLLTLGLVGLARRRRRP